MVQLGATITCAPLRMTMQVTRYVVTECEIMLYVNVPAVNLEHQLSAWQFLPLYLHCIHYFIAETSS